MFQGACTKGLLLGTTIAHVGDWAVTIQDGADVSLLFNTLCDGRGGGVLISNEGKGRLLGNSIWGFRGIGCLFQTGADALLTANKFSGGLVAGVVIQGSETRARLEETEIWGHTLGLEIRDGGAAEIAGSIIRDCRNIGVLINGYSRSLVQVSGCNVFGNIDANICVEGGADPIVKENFIHDSKSTLALSPRPSAATVPAHSAAGVVITGPGTRGRIGPGNLIYRSPGANLEIRCGADPLIFSNEIRGASCGIAIAGSSTLGKLRANDVSRHRLWEVSINEGAAPLLEGNTIHGGFGNGIGVSGRLTGGRIKDNHVYNFSSAGSSCLQVSDSLSLEITNNRIHGRGDNGVAIASSSTCTLSDNDVWGFEQNAIAIKGADPLISENKISASLTGVFFMEGEKISGRLVRNRIFGHSSACVLIYSGDPLISGNHIHHGGQAGVVISGPETFGRIQGNSIEACVVAGVEVIDGGRPALIGNFVVGNARFGVRFNAPGTGDTLVGAGNIFAHNGEGDVVILAGDGSISSPHEAGYYDRALCSVCGAAGAALKRCNGCVRHGKVFSPRYCGLACQRAHWKAHTPDCERAEARADEWLHAMDALMDLPGCPYGDLELLTQRRRQRELEAAEPVPGPSS